MNKNIDDKIVELIEKNEKISNSEISRIIGIPEKEVKKGSEVFLMPDKR